MCSGYALNLEALIKASKVSRTSQLSYEILRISFERKFDKTNFISLKRTPPKSPHQIGLIKEKKILIRRYTAFLHRVDSIYLEISSARVNYKYFMRTKMYN